MIIIHTWIYTDDDILNSPISKDYHNSHYKLYCQSQIKSYWFILMIIYWFIMITNQIHWFIMMIIFHTYWFIMMILNQIHWFITMITFHTDWFIMMINHTYWFIMMITALFTTFGPDTCIKCPVSFFLNSTKDRHERIRTRSRKSSGTKALKSQEKSIHTLSNIYWLTQLTCMYTCVL